MHPICLGGVPSRTCRYGDADGAQQGRSVGAHHCNMLDACSLQAGTFCMLRAALPDSCMRYPSHSLSLPNLLPCAVQDHHSLTRSPRSSFRRTTAPSRHARVWEGSGARTDPLPLHIPPCSKPLRPHRCCVAHHPPPCHSSLPLLNPAGSVQRIQNPRPHPRQGACQCGGCAGGDVLG